MNIPRIIHYGAPDSVPLALNRLDRVFESLLGPNGLLIDAACPLVERMQPPS
jgi:hypothetical protein